jgi:hypothetical protein
VKLVGATPFAKVQIVKDNQYVCTAEPGKAEVQFSWQDNAPATGKTSYYYVRGEQQNGELVWVSPIGNLLQVSIFGMAAKNHTPQLVTEAFHFLRIRSRSESLG